MKLLLLGGINEAVILARQLHAQGLPLVYSLAGLARHPELDCPVISGGFRRHGGLEGWLGREQISLVIDATHPYAAVMSRQAIAASRRLGIPCWRYQRAPWCPGPGDDWYEFEQWQDLLAPLHDRRAVFLTLGRLPKVFAENLHENRERGSKIYLRSANPPDFPLPPSMTWLAGVGPYGIEAERRLMNELGIDAVVAKNSGGEHTRAKLTVARERRIPVYLLQRPSVDPADRLFDDIRKCGRAALAQWRREYDHAG